MSNGFAKFLLKMQSSTVSLHLLSKKSDVNFRYTPPLKSFYFPFALLYIQPVDHLSCYLADKDFSNVGEVSVGSAIQIKPQRIDVKLRPGISKYYIAELQVFTSLSF